MRLAMVPLALGTEYYLFGGAGVVSLLAFAALILVPAIGSYGRTWEKATADRLLLARHHANRSRTGLKRSVQVGPRGRFGDAAAH
jgi:hypothetical protein